MFKGLSFDSLICNVDVCEHFLFLELILELFWEYIFGSCGLLLSVLRFDVSQLKIGILNLYWLYYMVLLFRENDALEGGKLMLLMVECFNPMFPSKFKQFPTT